MDSVSVAGSPDPTDGEGPSSTTPGGGKSAETGSTAAALPSRYESQKRRDWNTFLQYLRNLKPPLKPSRCSGAHVIEFLRYLDEFGKTKVHLTVCPLFGNPDPPAPCFCPLRQAWGSLDALVGRLRAAYEESGGQPESNPFGAMVVRIYLSKLRDDQAKARGIPYKKKRKRETVAENVSVGGGSSGGASDVAATVAPSTKTGSTQKFQIYLRKVRDEQAKARGIRCKQKRKRATAAENVSVGGSRSGGAPDVAATVALQLKQNRMGRRRLCGRPTASSIGSLLVAADLEEVGDEGKDQRKEKSSGGFFSSVFQTPDKLNKSAPDSKSRGEEDSECLQLHVDNYSDSDTDSDSDTTIFRSTQKKKNYSDATISISDHRSISGTAPEGGVLSTEELVRLNKMGEVVTQGQKLSLEDKDSLTKVTDGLSHSCEKEVLEEIFLVAKELEELNCDPLEVPPTISHHFSILQELDLSYTEINSLPQSISRLVALQKLFLRSCELLMELPPEIGELTNLEVLDLEGTEILCLPKEIAKLVNLTCLKVSFYGYANQTVIPRRVLSNLSRLKELIIDVTPYGEWWDVEVETIIDDMSSLKELTTLKLSLPTAKLLRNLAIFRRLANFRFTVGRHTEHFISRLRQDDEEEFNNWEKLKKGLKYINGSRLPNEVTEVFRNANAFFLQRHWTANSLSEFGHENMNEVKFCLVMECNEFQTVVDSEQFHQGKDGMSESEDFQDFDESIVLGSLEKLIIRYMKNMESVWKGPVGKGSLSNLKSLALHTCPNLTTLFTIDMFKNLLNLEELIVEDCPKINSLVSLKSSDSESRLFLPNLKNISLLELPKLVSISSGLCIAPNLKRMVIFYCPKLEKLSTMDVSSTKLKVIKGEKEWWDALKWYESDLSTEHEDYLARLFIPLRRDGDLMTQLTKD